MVSTRVLIVALTATVAVTDPGSAKTLELQDGNSTASFEINSALGQFTWTADGVPQLSRQAFWYRVGASGGESPLGSLNRRRLTSTSNRFTLDYEHERFTAGLEVTLTGGGAGSHQSQLSHALVLINTSATPLELYFFQYADFDVGGSSNPNALLITGKSTALQSGPDGWSVASLASPAASHVQAAFYPTLLTSLNNSTPTTLTDAAGPLSGDLTFGFQWVLGIPAGQTVEIAITQNITPEPLTCILLLSGLGLIGLRRRVRIDY